MWRSASRISYDRRTSSYCGGGRRTRAVRIRNDFVEGLLGQRMQQQGLCDCGRLAPMCSEATDLALGRRRSCAGISGTHRLAHAEVASHHVRTTEGPRQYPFGAPQANPADRGESRGYLIAGPTIQNSYSQFARRDFARNINDVLRFAVGKFKGTNIRYFESGYSSRVETKDVLPLTLCARPKRSGQASAAGCRPAQVHLLSADTSKQGAE